MKKAKEVILPIPKKHKLESIPEKKYISVTHEKQKEERTAELKMKRDIAI